jgi:hypothetical protein
VVVELNTFYQFADHHESNVGVPVFYLVSGKHKIRNNGYVKISLL